MHQIRKLKNAASTLTPVYTGLDRAGSALGRWISTDHSGFSRAMLNMPTTGFMASLRYTLTNLMIALFGSLVSALIVFVMIAYGMPALISALVS